MGGCDGGVPAQPSGLSGKGVGGEVSSSLGKCMCIIPRPREWSEKSLQELQVCLEAASAVLAFVRNLRIGEDTQRKVYHCLKNPGKQTLGNSLCPEGASTAPHLLRYWPQPVRTLRPPVSGSLLPLMTKAIRSPGVSGRPSPRVLILYSNCPAQGLPRPTLEAAFPPP